MTKKGLLIILALVLLVMGGYLIYYWHFQVPKVSKYNLTLQVKNWANMEPVGSLPVEVFKTDTGKKVATKKTDTEGMVTFILPAGSYSCRPGGDWTGKVEINLEDDSELELRILSVYR